MPTYLIHKDGAYNFFNTVVDCPVFEHGLTLEQVKNYTEHEYGRQGLENLYGRLERAHRKGSSSLDCHTLEDHIDMNRAGPNESRMSREDFINRFLAFPETTEKK